MQIAVLIVKSRFPKKIFTPEIMYVLCAGGIQHISMLVLLFLNLRG